MFTTADLFGKFHTTKAPLKDARSKLAFQSLDGLSTLFGSCFPQWLLAQADEGVNSRERVYTVRRTFWAFLWQVLNPGQPCRQAVRKIMAWTALAGGPRVKEDTSPFCQGRQRVPKEILQRILQASAQAADQRARQSWRFHDFEVVVGDGTTLSAPDTAENQAAFPQSARQAPGCGFPLLKMVALFSLTSGALLEVAVGNKHKSELGLFRKLWGHLKRGTLFLADRGLCDYVTLAGLKLVFGVESLLRLNASRKEDFRKGKRLGRYDRLVVWEKPKRQPRTVSKKMWRSLASSCPLRLIRYPVAVPGFRTAYLTLVTTLLDPVKYPAKELCELYLRRWKVELFLRDIKTTLEMDILSCKTPAMLRKEVLMHLIGYNLIRCVMVDAASQCEVDLERISFKGSLDTVREFCPIIARTKNEQQKAVLITELLLALVKDMLPLRPKRTEPRVQKRRPKAFPWMGRPRAELKARLLRSKSRKNKGA